MQGRSGPFRPALRPRRGLVLPTVLLLLPLLGAVAVARADEGPRALPPPAARRLPGRPPPGPGAPAAPAASPAAPAPISAPISSPASPAALTPASTLPLPRDPAMLPPPRVRRLAGTAVVIPSVPQSGRAAAPGPGLPAWITPSPRPPRPSGSPVPRPEDLLFEVERPGGIVKRYPEAGRVAAYVMAGNPRVLGQAHRRADGTEVDALSIKANTIVAWVDESRLPDLGGLADEPAAAGASGPRMSGLTSLFEEAVLGIYAEGAVEVIYGGLAFRAEALHFEPRTFEGLLIEPRFEGRILGRGLPASGVPVTTRARRGRLLAQGLMVFDDAEVSTCKADDRIAVKVRTLSVEEYDREGAAAGALGEGPALLGFKSVSTQRYGARQIEARGERIPLFWLPYATFGLGGRDPLPIGIKRVDMGQRSGLGIFGLVGVGASVGPDEDPWFDWVINVGGYTKRGPAAGLELSWREPEKNPRSLGKLESWGVFFDDGEDRNDFRANEDVRGRVVAENRTLLAKDLLFDAELGVFSDRGFNREYFERDDLTHKDRESYVRLLYRPGTWAASLTGKWHQRDFVTETVEAPQAGLWLGSVPVLTPGSPGGLGVDLTSVSRAGYLGRRFDQQLADAPYDALRADTDTRLQAGAGLGDVRLSGWVGASLTSYQERSDGGEDLTRSALLAGVRADLQLNRVFATRGGPFELEGLRHVVDLDAEFSGRFLDPTEPDEVPFFDARETERERTEATLRMRQRLQTRRAGAESAVSRASVQGAPSQGPVLSAGLRDVLDLETVLRWYPDELGPYLQDTPWSLSWSLRSEPLARGRLLLGSEGEVDGDEGLWSATIAAGWKPTPVVDLALAYRYLQDEASAPLVHVAWRFSEKYGVRFTESYNFRDQRNVMRLLFRRYSLDHVISFGVRVENVDDFSIELDLRPAIGGLVGDTGALFAGEVELDPTRAFR